MSRTPEMQVMTPGSKSHPGPTQSLKSRTFRAGSWALWGHFASLAVRFAGTLVLTRIFNPDTFGLLAVVTAIQVVITLLTDIGLRQAVVQSPNGDRVAFLHTAWTLQILRGVVIWIVGCVAAVLVSRFSQDHLLAASSAYSNPELPSCIAVASLSAIIVGFQSMKLVRASRELALKRVFAIEFIAQVVGLAFVISLGWYTRSVWSYIGGLLVTSLVTTVLSHVMLHGVPDRVGWDRDSANELLRFGKWTFISSALSALAANGDRLLLGNWISAQMLGLYSIASNLAGMTEGLAGKVFGSVAFPALSEAARKQPERVPEIFFRIRWVTDPALLSVSGFLFGAGQVVVDLLYDPRYAAAGWMLRYLSLSLIFSRCALSQSVYLALGRPEYVSILSVTKVTSLFVLVPVLFYVSGIYGAIIGVALHMFPVMLWTFFLNRRHHLNNVRLEVIVLGAWVLGWLAGATVQELAHALLPRLAA